MKKGKVGRPSNNWRAVKRTIPEPAVHDFEIWLANWKAKNDKRR